MRIYLLVCSLGFLNLGKTQVKLNKIAKFDSFLTYLNTNQLAMGSVLITQKDSTLYQQSFGYLKYSKTRSQLVNENTMYRIGSISKTVTAVLILQLVEKSLLNLNQKLASFYPSFPSSIKIRDLLNHQSGIYNFTDNPSYVTYMHLPKTKEWLLETIAKPKLNFEPGAKFSYSNSNYVLLTFILEDIYKMPFKEIVKMQISTPLNLTRFRVGDSIQINDNQCLSYTYNNETWEPAIETNLTIPLGAGNIISNGKDLSTFFNHLMYKGLLSKPMLDSMLLFKDGYGLGLMQFNFKPDIGYGHTGGIDGFISQAIYIPKDSVCIVVLTNGQNNYVTTLVSNAHALYTNVDFDLPSQQTTKLTKDELKKYVGKYRNSNIKMNINVFIKKDKLYAQATLQSAFELQPVSENVFAFNQAGILMVFNPLKNEFSVRQAGRTLLFKPYKIVKQEEKDRKKAIRY